MKRKDFLKKVVALAFTITAVLSGCSGASQTNPPVDFDEISVWIPTNGGTKYHSDKDCSNMKNPERVSLEYAIAQGFEACKKCYD